ncbi:hypothetical protein HMPREF1218_0798 [Hoylesella pleuritidis F0068]|uniref:Uncharacterized protein n=1 Tax=Hoylesella pleuritidis F0068 TaxID=1081904 RepID=U2MEN8_9BACT|nr:hypothetical protein HMPREF1218_0798 [Hoylesella pleuritidis F0068]
MIFFLWPGIKKCYFIAEENLDKRSLVFKSRNKRTKTKNG